MDAFQQENVTVMTQSAGKPDFEGAIKMLLQAFSEGKLVIKDDVPPVVNTDRPLTIKKQRARARLQEANGSAQLPQEVRQSLRHAPEPRRHRKARVLPPRVVYTLNPVTSGTMIHQLQRLTPAASAIVAYLVDHPRATVPELMAQTDLKRSTVQNLLSLLHQQGLISSDSAST